MVTDLKYLVTFPVMLTVALITSGLTTQLRRQARSSEERERHTEMLYRTSRSLLSAAGRRVVVSVGLQHLRDLLHRDVLGYVPNEIGTLEVQGAASGAEGIPPYKDPREAEAALWAYTHGRPAGSGTDTRPELPRYIHPLCVQERTLGAVVVACDTVPLSEAERTMLDAVAAQLALALDRERLALVEEEQRVEIERERLRNDLLRSISHDLRTPLASIAGASSMLFSGSDSVDCETVRELSRGIYSDATWLTRLVENLLSLTRVDEKSLKLNLDWEVAEELVASALEHFRGRIAGHQFRTSLPADPVLVKVDAGLIEQVLVNLVDNAIRYTPEGSIVEIRTTRTDREVIFEVADDGPGLSENALKHVFERFFTENLPATERRGLGLGLAISKSIIEAHGGTITAENREPRGAVFRFRLPSEQHPPSQSAGPEPRDD